MFSKQLIAAQPMEQKKKKKILKLLNQPLKLASQHSWTQARVDSIGVLQVK